MKRLVLEAIPLEKRVSWVSPAMVYVGCEFCIPVIMVGSGLIGSFTLYEMLFAIIIGLVIITWLGDGINSYLGAMTGRSSSVIARSAFALYRPDYCFSCGNNHDGRLVGYTNRCHR